MKIVTRKTQPPARPGLTGTARVDRHTRQLLARLRPGDVAIVDHLDLDRATAQALVDSGVVAVVNAGAMISGRHANLGPELLVAAGVLVLDGAGQAALQIREGTLVRLHEGELFSGDTVLASGEPLDAAAVTTQMQAARRGMVAQLATFTHNSTEFLQREESLLLHGEGLPGLPSKLSGRPVVVVAPGADSASELKGLRSFVREQRPVLIGVAEGVQLILDAGWTPDVLVLDGHAQTPSATWLSAAGQVVIRVEPGAPRSATEHVERMGVRPSRIETSATAEDVALLLTRSCDAPLVVAAGLDASLEEFLDSRRHGLAGAFLTRLSLGPRLVDASTVPALYSGRVRPRHLLLLLLVGLVVLAAALSVTPVGQMWATDVSDAISTLVHQIQGKFS